MRIVDVYKVVEVVFILTEGGPGLETELLALYVCVQGRVQLAESWLCLGHFHLLLAIVQGLRMKDF